MCLMCFSSQPLSPNERVGRYGSTMAAFAENETTFKISLCEAPCSEPCCCLSSMLCFCPVQVWMRHRALNHVEPGSNWSNYICFQGTFPGCCCLQPGQMCEENCPCTCMFLESCLCPGIAVSATSNVIRREYRLGLDADDVRLIRCNNCLQIFSCLFTCFAMCTECEGDDQCARVVDCIADAVFCSISGCSTAQTYHEIKVRESMGNPRREVMERH
jgi:hypothetical protein